MSQQLEFLNRTARRILIVAAILAVLRLLQRANGKPLVDILAVAIVAGATTELLRLRQAEAVDAPTRRLARILGVVAIACWAGGIWLERSASDQGAWIVVCGIVIIGSTAALEWIRKQATKSRSDMPAGGGAVPTGSRIPAIKFMTIPALRTTVFFIGVELVIVDWLGALAAHRIGFDEGDLFPLTVIVCGGAGFVARRSG